MEVHVDTVGAVLLSGAVSLLSASIPAAAYVFRKLPRPARRGLDAEQMAVLRTDLAYIKGDIEELKADVRQLRDRIR